MYRAAKSREHGHCIFMSANAEQSTVLKDWYRSRQSIKGQPYCTYAYIFICKYLQNPYGNLKCCTGALTGGHQNTNECALLEDVGPKWGAVCCTNKSCDASAVSMNMPELPILTSSGLQAGCLERNLQTAQECPGLNCA